MSDETTTDAPAPLAPTEAPLTLGGRPVTLRAPASAAEHWDYILGADGLPPSRAYAAALGLCWPWLRGHLLKERISYRGRVEVWGGQVFDHLLGKGVPITEIIRVGGMAHRLLQEDLPGAGLPQEDDEVKDLLGN